MSEPALQQTPAFKTGVDLVQVDVSVLDRDRKPIRGLTAADFTVLEDGKERPIVQFSPVNLLGTPSASEGAAAWLREVGPDVVSNEVPLEGRVVVVLFHQSIRVAQQPQARRIATAAIDALGPADIAAVMHVINGVGQNLTRDRARLLAAINASFMGLADTEAALGSSGGALSRGQCPEDRCSFEAITQIAESLRDVPRRKILLLITPDFGLQSPGSSDMKERREKMFRALDVANLAVYPIDPTGLETLALDAARISTGRPSSDRTPIMEANLYRQGNLMALGERSGGRAIVNANEAEVLVRGIYDESQSYYTLAFQSSSTAADGRFHAINVRVNRRDAAVHARKGHYAPARDAAPAAGAGTGPPPDLARAIERAWPSADVPLEMAVAAFADPSGARPFAAITVRSTAGGPRATVLTAAFDPEGRSVNSHWQALDLEPVLEGGGPHAYDLLSRLPLEPGRYEIRAAVRDERGAKLGTIASYIDVPDFAQSPLSLSDVVLEVTPAPLAAPSSIFAAALPVVPSAQRTFAAADRVRAFVRVYQGRGRVEPVTLTATIQDDRGKAVLDKKELLTPDMFGTERVADYLLDVPLESATAGTYRLRIVATRDARQASRDVRFVVEPTRRPPS